jgi:hypothetical protein
MIPAPNLIGMVAYPSNPLDLGQTISLALEKLKFDSRTRGIISWEENDIPGRFIQTEVMRQISDGNVFIADITRLNFNVVFEVGYAIGCKKRAILIRNKAIKADSELVREVGIFDTLGYESYVDSQSLQEIISETTDLAALQFDPLALNGASPVYLVLPPTKGDIKHTSLLESRKRDCFIDHLTRRN